MSDEQLPPPEGEPAPGDLVPAAVEGSSGDSDRPHEALEPTPSSVDAPAGAAVTDSIAAPTEAEATTSLPWVGFVTEKKMGMGQDGPPVIHTWTTAEGRRSIVAVFDGMGGAGSTLVPDLEEDRQVPMAYLASRVAAKAFLRGFSQMTPSMSPLEIKNCLEAEVKRALGNLMEREGGSPSSRVRGDMIKNYPTTVAAAIIDDVPEGRRVHPIWAGDSRVYALLPNELLLQQLTIDHTGSGDSNDGGDAALTRCATPEQVELESAEYLLPADAVVFVATDGCFAYQPTQFLVTTLIEELDRSHDCNEYSAHLAGALSSVSGDDCAISMLLPIGKSFAYTRDSFRPWLRELQDIRHVPRNNRFLTLNNNSTYLSLYRERMGH